MTTFYSASNQLQPLAAPHEHDSNTWTSNNSAHSYESSVTMARDVQRVSSPTPSEKEELKEFDGFFKKVFRKKSWQDKNFKYTVMGVSLAILLIVLLAVFHKDIVDALAPVSEWIKEQPAGFLIPIAFITILSIPPLLGAEIIQFMCGMIYGMWTGFAIVCAGTVLGEALTFFLFRYWLRSRAEKMEKSSLQWSALSRVIRESGFWVALVIRYSAVPTHISTGFYAACGLSFFLFLSTLVLALPRQLAGVVLGDLAAASATGETSKTDKIVSNTVLAITIIVTVFAMKWINKRMKAAALVIIRERRAIENAQLVAKEATFSNTMPCDPVGDAELGRSHGPQEASEADARESR